MNQQEFYSREDVKVLVDIQKSNPYGSDAHKSAFLMIRSKMTEIIGFQRAKKIMGDY